MATISISSTLGMEPGIIAAIGRSLHSLFAAHRTSGDQVPEPTDEGPVVTGEEEGVESIVEPTSSEPNEDRTIPKTGPETDRTIVKT
jgi:hypothetical protein